MSDSPAMSIEKIEAMVAAVVPSDLLDGVHYMARLDCGYCVGCGVYLPEISGGHRRDCPAHAAALRYKDAKFKFQCATRTFANSAVYYGRQLIAEEAETNRLRELVRAAFMEGWNAGSRLLDADAAWEGSTSQERAQRRGE